MSTFRIDESYCWLIINNAVYPLSRRFSNLSSSTVSDDIPNRVESHFKIRDVCTHYYSHTQ